MRFCPTYLVLCTMMLAGATNAAAKELTPAQALARARSAHSADIRVTALNMSPDDMPRLVFTLAAEECPSVYVFNGTGGGWMMLSADDAAEPLLAFSSTGSFDPRDTPEALADMMVLYQEEINHARKTQDMEKGCSAGGWSGRSQATVDPLLKTFWNQNTPFNDLCPEREGRRSPTGCVATAMAQVMAWHRYPARGGGEVSYNDGGDTLDADLSKTPLRWDLMKDRYEPGKYTAVQGKAVAELCKACGYAIHTTYGARESSAVTSHVCRILSGNFFYDKAVRYVERHNYMLVDWETLLCENLREYGPVQLRGSNPGGAHSFVCDGVAAGAMFHINWGWGGKGDGYFRMSALEPARQGIGGSRAGYNNAMGAVVNIAPPRGGTPYAGLAGGEVMTARLTPGGDTLRIGGFFYNDGTAVFNGRIYVQLEDEKGQTLRTLKTFSATRLRPGEGIKSFDVPAIRKLKLADGTYRVTLAYMADGTTRQRRIRGLNTQCGYVRLSVEGSDVGAVVPMRYDTYAGDMQVLEPAYSGGRLRVSFNLATDVPVLESVRLTPVLYAWDSPAEPVCVLGDIECRVRRGCNPVERSWTLPAKKVPAGRYFLVFDFNVGDSGEKPVRIRVSDMVPLLVGENGGEGRMLPLTLGAPVASWRVYSVDGTVKKVPGHAEGCFLEIETAGLTAGDYVARVVTSAGKVRIFPFKAR